MKAPKIAPSFLSLVIIFIKSQRLFTGRASIAHIIFCFLSIFLTFDATQPKLRSIIVKRLFPRRRCIGLWELIHSYELRTPIKPSCFQEIIQRAWVSCVGINFQKPRTFSTRMLIEWSRRQGSSFIGFKCTAYSHTKLLLSYRTRSLGYIYVASQQDEGTTHSPENAPRLLALQ